jgi:arginine decarboxylase
MSFTPTRMFLTKGMGRHPEKLTSFELALRTASIEVFNLVSVSSILPPECRVISKSKGLAMLQPGQIVFTVLSRNSTNEPHRLIGSSIGVAIPADRNRYGYLSEHHSFGQSEKAVGDYAEDLAASMLAHTLGIEIDLNKAWNERKEYWKIAGGIVRTSDVTQTAVGKDKLWTTVVAAGVFCG